MNIIVPRCAWRQTLCAKNYPFRSNFHYLWINFRVAIFRSRLHGMNDGDEKQVEIVSMKLGLNVCGICCHSHNKHTNITARRPFPTSVNLTVLLSPLHRSQHEQWACETLSTVICRGSKRRNVAGWIFAKFNIFPRERKQMRFIVLCDVRFVRQIHPNMISVGILCILVAGCPALVERARLAHGATMPSRGDNSH